MVSRWVMYGLSPPHVKRPRVVGVGVGVGVGIGVAALAVVLLWQWRKN